MNIDGSAPQGALQVAGPAALAANDQKVAAAAAAAQQPMPQGATTQLAGFVRAQFEIFRNHRNTQSGWTERLLVAMRTFNGQYDATKIQEIKKFGGSEVYARIVAQKCRAASSLLRDIYLGPDRPWGLKPPADPDVPPDIMAKIEQLVQMEEQALKGMPNAPGPDDFNDRRRQLLEAARDTALKRATDQAKIAEDKLEEILRDGGFYDSLAAFLVDLPVFPFAVLKGPVVKIVPEVQWPPGGGQPTVVQKPTLCWCRVNPFDIWWTPGVSDIRHANIIEKQQTTRAELNDLMDLPGYDQAAIQSVLEAYGRGGLYDNWDTTDAERAVLESRENPAWNRSGMISMMNYTGNVQGEMLQDYGLAVPDPLRDYNVQIWMIGQYVIKAQLSPNPRQRHPYYITSYEKVPGAIVGNGLVDILQDIQESANATLRSLINNLSISSGPQVVVNDERLAPDETGEDLYPWKRWHVRSDPAGSNSQPPVSFFMPTSNAETLLNVYKALNEMADDISAIPKYATGGSSSSGAGRTASGMAMLLSNTSKLLQTVSANIDRDVVEEVMSGLLDMVMLTDTSGLLTGEEKVKVQGVTVAMQRETERQRQIEFLAHTQNPVDQHIIGVAGRGKVLRSIATTIGLDGEGIVPTDAKLEQMQQAQQQAQQQQNQQAVEQAVQQGVQHGVEAGVKRIATELTAGILASRAAMPEGPPVHIGTPASGPSGPPGGPPQGQAPNQGTPPNLAAQGGPQTNIVSNAGPTPSAPPGPGAPGPQLGPH